MIAVDIAACAVGVHPVTMTAVVRAESAANPLAIGVLGARLLHQPANKAEAVATAQALEKAGYDFDVGIGQVNRHNLLKYGLDYAAAFDACSNLRVAALILSDCYGRATGLFPDRQRALDAALSCYCSGNFLTGLRPGPQGQASYVAKVVGPIRAPTAVAARRAAPTVASRDQAAMPADSVMVFR